MTTQLLFLGGVVAGVLLSLAFINRESLFSLNLSRDKVSPSEKQINEVIAIPQIDDKQLSIKAQFVPIDNKVTNWHNNISSANEATFFVVNNRSDTGTSESLVSGLSLQSKRQKKLIRPRWTPGDAITKRKEVITLSPDTPQSM